VSAFSETLLRWFDVNGRHDLPWQHPRTPYRVWLSEVMLQQTQVQTVTAYFQRFVERFPSLADLANADVDDVLALWSGLGYYSRARNLHGAARLCVERHGGELPRTIDALTALPGIGRSTAAAILAQAHGEAHAILDGNVKRVLARLSGETGWPGSLAVERRLWAEAEARLPAERLADYTQALMDFGATLCTPRRPRCGECPFRESCAALAADAVALLPARRPAKPLPTRQTRMLVIRNARGAVLLERRDRKGVWQGLWSLPEAADEADAGQWRLRTGCDDGSPLPPFTHVFSHYRLRVEPSLHRAHGTLSLRDGDAPSDSSPLRWAALDALGTIGLPRPVRTLLESLP